ncbi:MAG TPA: BrnT family toxin [Solirubrobacteraceae bacterium]|nr:BrnT family toxin [Solirubrobacteraceae bacterium]
METEGFDWDEANRGHVQANGLDPAEVEQALLDPARIGASAYNVAGEQRWAALGSTEAGRVLFVVFSTRGGRSRVVTARDATATEKRRYRKRGK